MAFTNDPTTDIGKVRLLIPDDVEAYAYYADDAKITALLTLAADMEGSDIFNAAALGCETIGSNQLMILKVTKLLDIQVDGAAVAREMRMRATSLRAQAVEASSDAGFEIAEMGLGHWSWIEQTINEALDD